jgi:hypothetical protein
LLGAVSTVWGKKIAPFCIHKSIKINTRKKERKRKYDSSSRHANTGHSFFTPSFPTDGWMEKGEADLRRPSASNFSFQRKALFQVPNNVILDITSNFLFPARWNLKRQPPLFDDNYR